jgi:uncharacterized protein YbgA (DUF1722 family)
MTHDDLQKTLAELRAELAHLDKNDSSTKEHINQLIATLEQHFSSPANDEQKATLLENVSSTIERFEAEHPRVTLILNQIMNTLSGSGI